VRLSILRRYSDATNPFHGLRRQSTTDLPVPHPALASMAIPVATTTFQDAPPAGTEFCVLNSGLCDRSLRDVAHSDRNRDLGTTATRRITELDSPPAVGRCDRDAPIDGLLVLVVAPGHAHGSLFLAVS